MCLKLGLVELVPLLQLTDGASVFFLMTTHATMKTETVREDRVKQTACVCVTANTTHAIVSTVTIAISTVTIAT